MRSAAVEQCLANNPLMKPAYYAKLMAVLTDQDAVIRSRTEGLYSAGLLRSAALAALLATRSPRSAVATAAESLLDLFGVVEHGVEVVDVVARALGASLSRGPWPARTTGRSPFAARRTARIRARAPRGRGNGRGRAAAERLESAGARRAAGYGASTMPAESKSYGTGSSTPSARAYGTTLWQHCPHRPVARSADQSVLPMKY